MFSNRGQLQSEQRVVCEAHPGGIHPPIQDFQVGVVKSEVNPSPITRRGDESGWGACKIEQMHVVRGEQINQLLASTISAFNSLPRATTYLSGPQ